MKMNQSGLRINQNQMVLLYQKYYFFFIFKIIYQITYFGSERGGSFIDKILTIYD